MSQASSVVLDYHLEPCPPPTHSPLVVFATAAERAVNQSPFTVTELPFGRASNVSGGQFALSANPALSANHGESHSGTVRVRAIECNRQTILELTYDSLGRLTNAVYPDGERVRYHWSDSATLRVDVLSGRRMQFSLLPNGAPTNASYGQNHFTYEYGEHGGLRECVFPDSQSTKLVYDRKRQILASVCGLARSEYERDETGRVVRCSFRYRDEGFVLAPPVGSEPVKLNVVSVSLASGSVVSSHALGSWQFGTDGRLEEMLAWNGERRCIRHDANTGSFVVWSTAGQTEFLFDSEGNLASQLGPTGIRTVFWPVPQSSNVLAISPDQVCLYEYDSRGDLTKTRMSHGPFALFRYDKRRSVKQVLTDDGWLKLRHDARGRLCRVTSASGLVGDLTYDALSHLSTISLRLRSPESLAQFEEFNSTIWQWTALRDLLRLEGTPGNGALL